VCTFAYIKYITLKKYCWVKFFLFHNENNPLKNYIKRDVANEDFYVERMRCHDSNYDKVVKNRNQHDVWMVKKHF